MKDLTKDLGSTSVHMAGAGEGSAENEGSSAITMHTAHMNDDLRGACKSPILSASRGQSQSAHCHNRDRIFSVRMLSQNLTRQAEISKLASTRCYHRIRSFNPEALISNPGVLVA